MFRKDVPSLFKSILFCLEDPHKAKIIQKKVESYFERLQKGEMLIEGQNKKETPTVYLWVTYFLAQMYDFYKNYPSALSLINLSIQHTPTAVELYMMKARIYKVFIFNKAHE